MFSYLSLLPFASVGGIHLYACASHHDALRRKTKPLLMPLLALFCLTLSSPINWFIIAALLFGFLGDTLLLFERAFNFGMAAFFVGHLFYVCAAISSLQGGISLILGIIIALICYALLLLGYIAVITPKVAKEHIAGTIYFCVICLMSLFTLLALIQNGSTAAWSAFLGSLVFIASDMVHVYNKFRNSFSQAYTVIMITYLLAQFCISAGLILI